MRSVHEGFFRRTAGVAALVLAGGIAVPPADVTAQSLRGSYLSMTRQNEIARDHDYTFLRDGTQVRRFVRSGFLVPIETNDDFVVHRVSYPYARLEVSTFIHRLASQYRAACGERLVVTSLTRPLAGQPRNASSRSVHPAGMAVDLRVPSNGTCRSWLERTLLSLESQGVLDATRERRPPHFHVAVFPSRYARYVEARGGSLLPTPSPALAERVVSQRTAYRVRRGDTLWGIARRHGVTVEVLRAENELRGSRIVAGQVLQVPAR